MTHSLICMHGHSLDPGEAVAVEQLCCPLCGGIVQKAKNADTAMAGAMDVTIVPHSFRQPASGGMLSAIGSGSTEPNLEEDASSAAFLPTTDFTPEQIAEAERELLAAEEEAAAEFRQETDKEVTPPELPGVDVMDELGRGGFGVVYRAFDEKRNREVALKTLQRMGPDDVVRFKNEFRALADIAHPNLASLYELLSDGKTWCFTMEILNGVGFLEYVWSEFESVKLESAKARVAEPVKESARLSLRRMNRLYDSLKQLVVGLNELHRADKLHSDIKPSNVLVTTEGRVVLLDFGLIAEIHRDDDGRMPSVIQGTPHYMSPEQAACQPLTEASDWYAVGVMLYEVLTGRLPFRDKPVRVMLRKQYEVPVEPAKRKPGVPPELNELCMALLEIDPAKRPSAVDILRAVDAEEIAETLVDQAAASVNLTVDLVGRETHFAALNQARDEAADGATRSVFIHGHSGMGKSALVRSFLDDVQAGGQTVVLEGRCYEQESVPFKSLDSLVDALVGYLLTLHCDTLAELLPADTLPLVRLFPVLAQVPGTSDEDRLSIDNADQQELRTRAMAALRELLTRLGERLPVVLYIDDLQWGDEDSANLLADLLRPPDGPRLLFLGAYRRENIHDSPSLVALNAAYEKGEDRPHRLDLPVNPLTETEAGRLALNLLGREDRTTTEIAERIAKESGGSPFFVWELAQHVKEGAGSGTSTGLFELDEVIWSRVCRLPEETRRLLEVFAVAGRPMRASEAYQVIDEVSHGPGLLAQLRTSHFIRTAEQEDDTIVETYHDRIRESVVNHLAAAKVRGHYLRLAIVIEQASGISADDVKLHISSTPDYEEPTERFSLDQRQWQRVFDLAFFFDAAGKTDRAFPYALIAADQTFSQNALEVAEQQYRIAQRGVESVSAALRFRVAEGLGDVLMMRGRYDDAGKQLELASSLSKNNVTAARIEGKLGALAFKQGTLGPAGDFLEKALTSLGERPPGNGLSVILSLCKEATVQVLHTFFPSLVGRRNADSTEGRMDLFRARLFNDFTRVCWYARGVNLCLWSHLRQMNLTERYPPSAEMANAYSFHSIVMTGLPLANRGKKYAQQSHDIWKDRGDLWGQGQSLSFYTFSYFVLGEPEKAIETSSRAVELLEQAGDVWEANMARMMNTWSLYHAGDLRGAFRQIKRVLVIGKEVGDYSAMAIALCFWNQIDPQSAPEGEMQIEAERPREDATSGALAIQGRGLEILFRENDPQRAAQVLQDSLDLCRKKGIRNVCVFASATWKVTALRIAAEQEPAGPARQNVISQGRKAARTALGITKQYRTCRAHLLRECGLLETLAENAQKAQKYFDNSIELAEQQGARRERAKSQLARAEAGIRFGWPDAEQQAAEARQLVEEIENLEGV